VNFHSGIEFVLVNLCLTQKYRSNVQLYIPIILIEVGCSCLQKEHIDTNTHSKDRFLP